MKIILKSTKQIKKENGNNKKKKTKQARVTKHSFTEIY